MHQGLWEIYMKCIAILSDVSCPGTLTRPKNYLDTSTMVLHFPEILTLLKKVSAVKQSISISFFFCCTSHTRTPN